MRLRNQLLLLALVVLVLPWAGWQFVRELEARLREGQAAALADSAGVVAGALGSVGVALPPSSSVWFVHESAHPLHPDGDPAEWGEAWARAQVLGAAAGDHAIADSDDAPPPLRVALAWYGGALHLFAERSGIQAIAGGVAPEARARSGAHPVLRLLLDDGSRVRALRFSGAGSGSVRPLLEGGGEEPPRVLGHWRDTEDGYRLELRLPAALWPQRLGVEAVETRNGGSRIGTEPDRLGGLWPLARHSPALSARLAAIVPPGLRAQVLHPDGWELASAGALDPAGASLSALQRGIYALLAEEPPPPATPRERPALLRRTLADGASTAWRREAGGVHLQLTALAPLAIEGRNRAVLQLERRSDAAVLAQQALSGLLGATVLAMLAVGAVLFAYASWLGFRVRRLGRAVDQAMAHERGAPAAFPVSTAQDELGELSRRFARLLDEVAGYTDYLRALASRLSHELHTPLAIVRSSLENLEAQAQDPKLRPYIERARDGSARLAGIIRAMSEATRVERAIAGADAECFDLRELVEGCAEGYRALLAPRRLELLLPPEPLRFHGAPELLAQALDKLVDNARTFCPPGGWIALALATRGEMAEIAVANSGPRLPTEAHGRLFDSLVSVRAAGAREDGVPHLGLGLHIVRLIVELHRGEVLARDLPGGDGVEFRLRLRGMPDSAR